MEHIDYLCAIDQEVAEGLSHFVCDVCDIAYTYTQVGFCWYGTIAEQGRKQHGLYYACKTCLEELSMTCMRLKDSPEEVKERFLKKYEDVLSCFECDELYLFSELYAVGDTLICECCLED